MKVRVVIAGVSLGFLPIRGTITEHVAENQERSFPVKWGKAFRGLITISLTKD